MKIVASKDKKTTGTGIALTFNVTAPTTVTAGKSYSVSLNDGETKYFLIKPTTSKTYIFCTTGSADTYGTLYRSADGTVVTQNDDTSGLNFSISQYLTAGKSYIIGIELFSGSGTTTLTVK